jgi:anaerobic sulfite reductase subunit C
MDYLIGMKNNDARRSLIVKPQEATGAIRQRQEGVFILRLKIPVGKIGYEQLVALGNLASTYGRGELHLTTRQGIEIPWIPAGDLPAIKKEILSAGFSIGASGPHIRVITACPGNLVCRHGLINAQEFGRRLDSGYAGAPVPHKFKIAVSGCPNCCMKPRENDVGFSGMAEPQILSGKCIACKKCITTCREGAIIFNEDTIALDPGQCVACGDCITGCPQQALTLKRQGLAVYIGGKMGRHPVLGTKIAEFVDEVTATKLLDRTLAFYRREGRPGERLADTIKRAGKRAVIKEIREK